MIFSLNLTKSITFLNIDYNLIKYVKLIVIVLSFLFINNHSSYSVNLTSNYDLFAEMSNKLADSLFKNIINNKYDSVSINISEFPAKRVLEKTINEKFISSDIVISDDTPNQFNLVINRFDISYQKYEFDEDSLNRILILDCYVKGKNSFFKSFEFNYSDKISRDDIPLLEISGLDFTKPPVPQRDRSFYKSFFEPAILATSAILTVIILFSVRSK